MKFNYEEYKDIGISNIKGTEDMKKLLYLSELGHMIYLFSDSPITVVSNPCGIWEDMSLDEDIALERTLKAYAQDCQVYRQCIKSILEVLKDSPDDDWIVKYIKARCNEALYSTYLCDVPNSERKEDENS